MALAFDPLSNADLEDLAWHYNSAAGAMGLRSGFGAMVAALEGLIDTGYHSYEISDHALEAAARDRRIVRALAQLSPAHRHALETYCLNGHAAIHQLAALTVAARDAYSHTTGAPRAQVVSIRRRRLKPKKPKPAFGLWLVHIAERIHGSPSPADRALALRIVSEARGLLNEALQEYRRHVRRRE